MTINPRHTKPALALAISLFALMFALTGCGGGRPGELPTFPVEGTVRFNGKPTDGATIVFTATEPTGKHPVVAQATADRDGKYTLSTYMHRDGAPAGVYAVTIIWPEPRTGKMKEEDEPADRLRGKYGTPKTTPLKATVREQSNVIDFTLP